jgi:hypothetical protein
MSALHTEPARRAMAWLALESAEDAVDSGRER